MTVASQSAVPYTAGKSHALSSDNLHTSLSLTGRVGMFADFGRLDIGFVNVDAISDEVFTYSSSDVASIFQFDSCS